MKQTWTEALFLSSRDTCSNMPGHLVTIESKAENDVCVLKRSAVSS